MTYNWGFVDNKDNATLSKEFKHLQQKLRTVKDEKKIEKYICMFLTRYLKIGTDPTDTIIRDNVWVRLLQLTKNKISEQNLDAIWDKAMQRRCPEQGFCVIQ
jgi:hypothetical protein